MKRTYLTPKYEKEILEQGFRRVVGIDEVGRGCWAGPVAVGAFSYNINSSSVRGVNDSKLLTAEQREKAYEKLFKEEHVVEFGSVESINKLGIGKTIESLITKIVESFDDGLTFFIIDGQFSKNFGKNTKKAIKADSTYYSVAAASILAKVERDRLMHKLHNDFPMYRFDKNKGYATEFHRKVIDECGICELHRKNWKPMRNLELKFDI